VSSRLDYVNSILSGCPPKHSTPSACTYCIALARVPYSTTQQRSRASHSHLLNSLNSFAGFQLSGVFGSNSPLWLIKHSYWSPTMSCRHLQHHKPSKSTHSSSTQVLSVPRHNLSFGSRAFHVSGPRLWKSLPFNLQQSQTLSSFRRLLNSRYFQSAYPAP